jgi:hypothetical protein
MMPKHAERNTKDSKNPEAQHVTGLKVTPPSPMALEQVKNVKMQLTVNIKTNAGPATNISQLLRLNTDSQNDTQKEDTPTGRRNQGQ